MIKKILAVLLAAFIFTVFAQDNESNREKFDPAKDPFQDLQTVIVKAQQENKRIILDVGGEWCIWCHRLDAFIEANAEIKKLLNDNFISLKVNFSKENKNEKFLAQYPKIEGYPHIFVLEKNGSFLHSQNTGLLESEKSYSKEKILEFLRTWSLKKSE